jgi:hypothetical protein
VSAALAVIERIVDASAQAGRIEALLPAGVRPRQLTVRTLPIGMLLTMRDCRPAHLRRVHQALLALPEAVQRRLGVIADWSTGPHQLTYRQLEYTYTRIDQALSKPEPDGSPSEALADVLDRLLEASVQVLDEPTSGSYAADWTDQPAWSRPPPKLPKPGERQPPHQQEEGVASEPDRGRRDREAAWGRRHNNAPGPKDEAFFGYYLQVVCATRDEHGPEVPEPIRRIHIASCAHDPPNALVPAIARIVAAGIPITDLLADTGYSYRVPQDWALALRALGIDLIQDLHPNDRGPHGTHQGATCANGNLYCPATPPALLELGPLARGASAEQTDTHDRDCAELQRYKLSPITGYDRDGYRRVICPAAHGKLRCPHRPESLTLSHDRPTILTPPDPPPVCCTQKTITIPPSVNAKTAQKHDWGSREHRLSYNRRTTAERAYATLTDPATNDLTRHGWCRLTTLPKIALFDATAAIARNIRIADAFHARQAENKRRAELGLPSKQRKRRRTTTQDPISAANAPP